MRWGPIRHPWRSEIPRLLQGVDFEVQALLYRNERYDESPLRADALAFPHS